MNEWEPGAVNRILWSESRDAEKAYQYYLDLWSDEDGDDPMPFDQWVDSSEGDEAYAEAIG